METEIDTSLSWDEVITKVYESHFVVGESDDGTIGFAFLRSELKFVRMIHV